jgi:hypothetical protein
MMGGASVFPLHLSKHGEGARIKIGVLPALKAFLPRNALARATYSTRF